MTGRVQRMAGAVLAGGAGRRLGGEKAVVRLGGRPLIEFPVMALGRLVAEVTIIAKPDTVLPALPAGVRVAREPARPRHPLVGIVHALRAAGGRPVLVCAADMPFVSAEALAALIDCDPGGAPAVIAADAAGALHPLLGVYMPAARARLAAAAAEGTAPVRAVVAGLGPRTVTVDEEALFNVNSPEDLAAAEARLRSSTRT